MKTLEQRLLARTVKGAEGECWVCSYSLAGNGYPQMNVNGKMEKAHRVAYRLWKGEIPPGLCVCHECDNRRCVNPAHLWVGTQQNNMTDMVEKGRHGVARGEKHCRAKLTEQIVREIRSYKAQGCRRKDVADLLKLSYDTVGMVWYGYSWKHIT